MARRLLWGMAPILVVGAIIWRERLSGYHERLAEQHFSTSEALAHQGDIEGARREMAEALREDPRYAEARDGLATIYSTNGDAQKAIRLYNEGIALQPRVVSLRYDLAELYFARRQYDHAILPLEDAVKIDPDFLPGVRLLGLCYEKSGRLADANRTFHEASRRHPDDPALSHSVARIERVIRDRAISKRPHDLHPTTEPRRETAK